MYGVAVMTSGNFALRLADVLAKEGYFFEVIATPCKIAIGGCGYSIKFPLEFKDQLLGAAKANNIPVVSIYKVIPGITKNNYEKI